MKRVGFLRPRPIHHCERMSCASNLIQVKLVQILDMISKYNYQTLNIIQQTLNIIQQTLNYFL